MFRAVFDAYNNKEGFDDIDEHTNFIKSQQAYFGNKLTNTFPTTVKDTANSLTTTLQTSVLGLGTWDPNTRQQTTRDINLAVMSMNTDTDAMLLQKQTECATTSIDDLLNTQNPSNTIRCGWIYKKGTSGNNPQVSQGALGTRTGPVSFVAQPNGQWFWNLRDAKKEILKDRCAALTNCANVGSTSFQECAYSTTKGSGIPVNAQGRPLYPSDPLLSAPASSLVTQASKCPPPPAPGTPGYDVQRSRDVCTLQPDGTLSRDCMLQQVTAAGCKTDGALYRALINEATPTNYLNGALNLTSYKKYQQYSTNPLLEASLKQGQITTDLALANFQKLSQESGQVKETALNYAARDLCLKQGTMDLFDFCLELADSTPGPFGLDCLQREFRKMGGQPAGSLYPTPSTKSSTYDKLSNWGAVKTFISDLQSKIQSGDEAVQKGALAQFLGIQRKPALFKQIARTNGLEVLWFNRGTNTFLGRRTPVTDAKFPTFSTGGEIEGTKLFDLVEYYAFTNIRPSSDMKIRLRLEADDGIVYALNQSVNGNSTRGQYLDTYNTTGVGAFGANWDRPPTTYTANQCWNLTANGPNYISGFWQETGGWAHCKVLYAPCGTSTFQPFPSDWFSLVQEPDAPVFSWQGRMMNNAPRFTEVRMPVVMDMVASSKTSIQNYATHIFKNMNSALKLKTNGNGFANVRRNFAMNSWRTLTLGFLPLSTSRVEGEAAKLVLKLGPLSVYTFGTDCVVRWNSATLNVEKTFAGVLMAGQEYYLAVNMKSDRNGRYPNRIKFAIGKTSDWNAGLVSLENLSNNSTSYSTSDNSAVFNVSDSAELVLGDKGGNNTADIAVAFVRLFDYELVDTDCRRDMTNAWEIGFTG